MQKSEKKQGVSPKKKALQRDEQVAGRSDRQTAGQAGRRPDRSEFIRSSVRSRDPLNIRNNFYVYFTMSLFCKIRNTSITGN